jgi:hypothetical protein
MQKNQIATGLIVHSPMGASNSFCGSCFAYGRSGAFLTAAHCVTGLAAADLRIGIPALGNALHGNLQVVSIEIHPVADVALMFTEQFPTDAVGSIGGLDYAADWGERIVAFGYPEDTSPTGITPTPRMSVGTIQRFFKYDDGRGGYSAIELSFPAPAGLSGAPVSRTQDTGLVIGVVCANHSALTYTGSFEVTDHTGTYQAKERDVVRYGIAVYLPDVIEWIEHFVPPTAA